MTPRQPSIASFLAAIGEHWLEATSGGLSVPFAVYALFVDDSAQKVVFGILAFAAAWLAAYRIWATERRQVLSLSAIGKKEQARLNLADLRARGVALRNIAEDVFDQESEWTEWSKSVVEWNAEVIEVIRATSAADAVWFSILDVVPSPRIELVTSYDDDEKRHLYSMHDYRLARLDELIQRHRS